jgi:signal transduction histidine kinase
LRLTLWYLAIFGLVLLAFAAVAYGAVTNQALSALTTSLGIQSQQLAGTYDSRDGLVHPPPVSDIRDAPIPGGEILLLLTPAGQVKQQFGPLTGAGVAQAGAFAQQHLPGNRLYETYTLNLPLSPTARRGPSLDFLLMLTLIQVQGQHAATLVLGILRADEQVGGNLLFTFAVTIPMTLLLIALGGYWLATRAMRPVRLITRTAQQIGETNLSRRLQVPGRDELAELAGTFNQMLGRLEAAFERQRQFTADASHELRTPLTIINNEANRVLVRRRTPEEYEQTLLTIQAEGAYMARLVSDLLTLARRDARPATLDKVPVDLSDLTLEVVERLAPLARQCALTLSAVDLPEVLILGDALALSQMLTNLIENAIKYAGGVGTQVQVETGCREQTGKRWAWVRVADDGPGIDADHLAHLFDRFYRIDPARSRPSEQASDFEQTLSSPGGSGLGLSIVQQVAQTHGGEVRVQSEIGRGTMVEVWLPLADGEQAHAVQPMIAGPLPSG